MNKLVYVGMTAKFFHPKTMSDLSEKVGSMCVGTVVEVLKNGLVRIKFRGDSRVWTTYADNS